MGRSGSRAGWIAWALSLAVVLTGLGVQIRYAEEALRCVADDRLVLCSGPLAWWIMPATVGIGLALVAVAGWQLLIRAR